MLKIPKLLPIDFPSNRIEFPNFLLSIQASKVAEIGVWEGDHLKNMMRYKKCDFFAIDAYTNTQPSQKGIDLQENLDAMWKRLVVFSQMNPNLRAIRKLSLDAAKDFPDEYFDFVYIDADHIYEESKQDINAWWPKIKRNGYLSGHDYCKTTLQNGQSFGVIEAVNEFVSENKLELHILSCVSWLIKKP